MHIENYREVSIFLFTIFIYKTKELNQMSFIKDPEIGIH